MIPRKPRAAIELCSRDLRLVRRATIEDVSVVVGVTCRGPGDELTRCLASIERQTLASIGVVLLLDGVGAHDAARDLSVPGALADRTWVLSANCGSASRARNAILDFVDEVLPQVRWVARLDGDDALAHPAALRAAVALGETEGAVAVLGGNRVLSREGTFLRDNPASAALRDPHALRTLLADMAAGTAYNELPSCNLVLQAGAGVRYPDIQSAEDHWLVADLLFHHPQEIAILEAPLYADYHLDGPVTRDARGSARHAAARRALSAAVETWAVALELPGQIIGFGQEGIVRRHEGRIYKHFYPGALRDDQAEWLARALVGSKVAPAAVFERDRTRGAWIASYPDEETRPFTQPDPEAVRAFLRGCLRHEIVCANVKRSNFRVRADGSLLYIDLGSWILPMDVSYLRDAAARLYSIGVRGASDEELLRRPADQTQPEVWTALPGFADFYGGVVGETLRAAWSPALPSKAEPRPRHPDVTLLLKACAMDARDLRAQVIHLVDQLTRPSDFAERLLVVDPFPGPFLRQHAEGDLARVLEEAEFLLCAGVLDRVLIGPSEPEQVRALHRRWFGVDAPHTHAEDGVPVAPQVWAFEQVVTRYVLQADVDVLVGRRRLEHDFLGEMLNAAAAPDVTGVAFDIPHEGPPRPYDAPPGEHKPEVRLGLLDLTRLRALLPLPASARDGRLTTTWYRALHAAQRARGLRTLRGGHGDSFYLHPPNPWKADAQLLDRVRDLVSQGLVPPEQLGRWDVEAPPERWRYPARDESVVVLARGRNTPPEKVARFAAGLRVQEDQRFGVVVIDDASDDLAPAGLREALAWLGSRLTLVRQPTRRGHVWNNRLAITGLCTNPDTMILIVDLDDALAHPAAVGEVAALGAAGHDVVLAAPFRPDAPTCVYAPRFDRVRETYGGDVWIHLRAFRKALFDALPDAMFQIDGVDVGMLEDYATMIPLAERARAPIYLPRYRYWHERTTVLDAAGVEARDRQLLRLLAKGPNGEER